jgi:hypothetical protein
MGYGDALVDPRLHKSPGLKIRSRREIVAPSMTMSVGGV